MSLSSSDPNDDVCQNCGQPRRNHRFTRGGAVCTGGRRFVAAPPPPRDDFPVRLTLQDADHLLAAVECVLNQDDSGKAALGIGLQPWALEQAARKIEAVADLARRGVATDG